MSEDDIEHQNGQEARDTTRQFLVDVWRKYNAGTIMQPLEALIAGIIVQHPEYHNLLEDSPAALETDFDPDAGESNPFLHMGLHITIQEQVGADRPIGIRDLYEIGLERLGDAHLLEHRIMECLGEVLWQAQRDQTMPDEVAYLEGVRRLVGFT